MFDLTACGIFFTVQEPLHGDQYSKREFSAISSEMSKAVFWYSSDLKKSLPQIKVIYTLLLLLFTPVSSSASCWSRYGLWLPSSGSCIQWRSQSIGWSQTLISTALSTVRILSPTIYIHTNVKSGLCLSILRKEAKKALKKHQNHSSVKAILGNNTPLCSHRKIPSWI